MNSYLIPANSKKSMLKFGLFTTSDLVLFLIGLGLSFLFLFLFSPSKFFVAILDVLPGAICGFLVMPVPNHHNVRTVIKSAIEFFTTRQRFVWKGWCFIDEEKTTEK